MRRSRRKRRQRRVFWSTLFALTILAGGGWWWFGGADEGALSQANGTPGEAEDDVPLVVDLPEPAFEPKGDETAAGEPSATEEVLEPVGNGAKTVAGAVRFAETPPGAAPADEDAAAGQSAAGSAAERTPLARDARYARARKLLDAGEVVEARHLLNALLHRSLSPADENEVRRLLTKIADETIFSRRAVPGDPLVEMYRVQSGDRLVKIGRKCSVPAELLMEINGIEDATRLRAGAQIKLLRGPFHLKIDKSRFRMDVYLQDLYVRSYRVALGADQGTPEGTWRVKERLPNPTYYPPASAPDKRIIPPDDPENPLGEHWIGLEGISGDAVGRTGFGIHGTIEPESIGKAVSLGCIRMHNDDVALVYSLMMPGESTVTVTQ